MSTVSRLLVVDGANVVGSRPDGWWKDRAGAARRLHERLLVADLSYDEVAEICGIALGTVKSRVCRARAMLSQILESGQLPDFRHNFVLSGDAIDAFFAELARIANINSAEAAAA